MHRDSDNADYKDGNLVVFDDRLGFTNEIKHLLESTMILPTDGRETFVASVEPSVLTVEKKWKPDGNYYFLVRKATFSEERELFPDEDEDDEEIGVPEGVAGRDAGAVVVSGPVTRSDVHQALAFLIDIEPDPDEIESAEEYERIMEEYHDQIEARYRTLRTYAEQIENKTLDSMQEVYYSFTNDPRYVQEPLWTSIVTGALSSAWDGVGPWRR